MALSAIFRFENLDSTSDLNSLYDGLFKKGIYEGGSIVQSTSTSIAISEFKAISDDGMHIISDSIINLSIPSTGTKYFIVCKAKYVYDDSPIITMSLKTESALSADAEKNYYIKLGSVTLNGVSASINLNDDRDELSVLGRNPYKGIFDDAETLESETSGKCQEGDWAVVSADSNNESVQIYIYSSGVWGGTGNAKILSTSYNQHIQNAGAENVNISHNVPTETEMEGNEDKGAFHISYNQLKAIPSGVSSSNKLVAENNSKLLTEDQSDALKGNTSGGTPNNNNRFITSDTPIATFVNVSATMVSGSDYIQISLPSSTPGYFVGKGVKGTAQYYFEIRNSDNTDVLLANGKPVVACGVYVGDNKRNISSEISPADYGSNNYYWYESSSENKYLYLKTGDIDGSATKSDITSGTCSVNLYCGTNLGSIDGDATSQRIYKQGLRQFSVVTFDEAISGNLKIQNDTITINPSSTVSLSLGVGGLVYETSYQAPSNFAYIITPSKIKSYSQFGQYNYNVFSYDSGKLSIENQSSTNNHTEIIIDTTASKSYALEYKETYNGITYHATLDYKDGIKIYNPNDDSYYSKINYDTIQLVSNSLVSQISENGVKLLNTTNGNTATLTYNNFKISNSVTSNEITSSTITLTSGDTKNTITNSYVDIASSSYETSIRQNYIALYDNSGTTKLQSVLTPSSLVISNNPASAYLQTSITKNEILIIDYNTHAAGYLIHLGWDGNTSDPTVAGGVEISSLGSDGNPDNLTGFAHLYTRYCSNENLNSGDSFSANLYLGNSKNFNKGFRNFVALGSEWVSRTNTSANILTVGTHYSDSLINHLYITSTYSTDRILYSISSDGYLNITSNYQLGIWSNSGSILLGTNGNGNVIIGNSGEVRLNGNIYLQGDTLATNTLTINGETKCKGGMLLVGNINTGSSGSAILKYHSTDTIATGTEDPLFGGRSISKFGYGSPSDFGGFSLNPYDYVSNASNEFFPFAKNENIGSGKYIWIINTAMFGAQDSTYQYVFKPLFAVFRRSKDSTGDFEECVK